MRTASTPQLRQVLARGSFDSQWTMDVFYDNQRRMQDVPVTNVQMSEDGTAKVQQGGSLVIVWQDPAGKSIAPRTVDDLLSPFGTTLRLYEIISTGPLFTERVPMGSFVISDTPTIESVPWSFMGRVLSKGDRIKVTFKDPFYKVQRNRFDVPGVTPSLTSVYAEIQRLTRLPITRNPQVPDGPIPRAMVYEEDRLDAVYELANILDALPYMMSDGTLSLRPKNWTPVVDVIAAANAGDDPADLAPLSYTAWVEQSRNIFTNPRWASTTLMGLYNSSTAAVAGGVVTVTAGVNDAPSLFSMLYPVPLGAGLPWSARFQVRRKPGDSAQRALSIRPQAYNVGSGVTWATVGNGNQTVTLTDEWQDVEFYGYVQAATGNNVGVQFVRTGPWPLGQGFEVRRVIQSPTSFCPMYYDGATQPDGGIQRTRWLGAVDASISVIETRQVIPAVPGLQLPNRGTLLRVGRGMSAEGVYNRVVVRAQGQQAGVLAADEIVDGPLRAANVGGADSPFGRVPYFLSSQFIVTIAQAVAEVRKWLPRVSRPQAAIMDIEEVLNPLREVGDVVTILRVGETFPARVVKIKRTSGKTQTTSVMVVPSA